MDIRNKVLINNGRIPKVVGFSVKNFKLIFLAVVWCVSIDSYHFLSYDSTVCVTILTAQEPYSLSGISREKNNLRKKRVCEIKHLKRIKLYCSKGLLRKKEQTRRLEQLSMLFKVKKNLIVSKFSIITIIVIKKIIILQNNHHNSRDINQNNLYN